MTRDNRIYYIYIPYNVFKDSFIYDKVRIKLLPISQLCLQKTRSEDCSDMKEFQPLLMI